MRYERVALPEAGGVNDQPARDMEALDVLAATAQAVLNEQAKEQRARAKREKGRGR